MGYKHTDPVCYLVCWDDAEIVKAGYSHCQRWRKFVIRGARVVRLLPFQTSTEAFVAESILHDVLHARLPYAFDTPADSRPYMGRDCGGYAECFRYSSDPDAVEECVRIADALSGRSAVTLCTDALERTERTHADVVESDEYLT